MRTAASVTRMMLAIAGVLAAAAVLLSGAPAAVAAGTSVGTVAAQSVNVSAWPQVSMRVVLAPDMLTSSLTSSDFSLKENGSFVASVTARPLGSQRRALDVILLIDVSGSMRGKPLVDAKAATTSFLSALGERDRVSVIAFSDQPSIHAPFTADRATVRSAIASLSTGGSTSLYDALTVAAGSFESGRDADRDIVLLSDGGDTTSGNTLTSASAALTGAAAHVYAVALTSADMKPAPLTALAASTGGRLVEVGGTEGLAAVFGGIAKQITRPYEVTYTSLRPPAKDLEIDVVVSGREAQTAVTAVVANPDVVAAARLAPATAAALPAAGWPAGIAVLVFAAVGVLVAVITLLMRPEPNAIGQLKYYEQLREKGPATEESDEYADPQSVRGRLVAAVGTVAAKRGFDKAIRGELERAGLPLRPTEYITLHAAAILVGGLAVEILTGSVEATVLAVLVLAFGPIFLLSSLGKKRTGAFQTQLPDVLNLLSGSLRAGWGLLQAAGMVVNEIPAPAGPEFERVVTEARLGLPLEEALGKMADRMQSEDFRWAVTAIAIQREVGGNLAEVLDLVAETVRERAGLRGQVQSLTAEGRLSAVILVALPFVEGVALWFIDHSYFSRLVSSPMGLAAAIGASVLLLIGVVWLRQIVRIEV